MGINLLSYPPCTVCHCCCQIPPNVPFKKVCLSEKLSVFQKDFVYRVINHRASWQGGQQIEVLLR